MNHYHLVGYPNIKQFKRFFIQEGVGLVGANDLKIYNFTMSYSLKRTPKPRQAGLLPSPFTSSIIFLRPHCHNSSHLLRSHGLTDGCLISLRLF